MEFLGQSIGQKANSLQDCLRNQMENTPLEHFCNATWDTVLCWPPTLKGHFFTLPCPEIEGFDNKDHVAIKTCGNDGLWEGKHPGAALSWDPGWTNYSSCKGVEYENQNFADNNATNVAPISLGSLPVRYTSANVIACILLAISVIFSLAALGISFFSKNVQLTRNRMFRNIFTALLLHDILEFVVNISRTMTNADAVNDVETCVAIGVIVTLTSTALFVWMLIVSVCFTMTLKGYVVERRIYLVLCLLGWFVPTVITTTWLSVTVLGGKLKCWFAELYIADLESTFWIVEVCNIVFITGSWMAMINFTAKFNPDGRRKCQDSKNQKDLTNELQNIRESSKRVTVTLGYLTLTYVVYLAYAHFPLSETVTYLFVFCVYSRGAIVPLLLSFLEESCHCWDGMYKVTVIRELGEEDLCDSI